MLAALQLQALHGDFKAEVHKPGWLAHRITECIPQVNNRAKEDAMFFFCRFYVNRDEQDFCSLCFLLRSILSASLRTKSLKH